MRSIGEMARDSGLSVSALRFYDGAGVFGPARVDPRTGYRWYAPDQLADARLIARLRRVGMPLPDISRVLTADRADARLVLDRHLRRLEDGLADARRELSTVRTLIDQREISMTATRPTATRLTVPAAELAAALDAVRFAVGTDAGLPAVTGVLLELEADVLRLVATDRYRLAVSQAPADGLTGPAASVIAPVAFVDGLRALLAGRTDAAVLEVDGAVLTATVGDRQVGGERIDQDYPDYRRMLRLQPTRQVPVGAAALRETLSSGATRSMVRGQDGAECEVSVLVLDADGTLTVSDSGSGSERAALSVGVNREFLLEALDAVGQDQLVLELGGPIVPLAIRFPARQDTFSLLMPTRLS
ncbi:MerR family transcriptional regulator [Kitasatospora sp. MAP5-34]|uniref:DNA polymerase III subunit beta family protein n=1 Tax=Kitasatospora sp. MAP5-34 TaxID=3035102 RepID=UPI00247421D3|nr:MerR family transcriptional regulator [Kitasatospora sp. MAP5-34]MDH6574948.1 DNA polymerase III sliding clamp (beta) subunit (PCNA family) [Kitasatospora sp. MAP5-34]